MERSRLAGVFLAAGKSSRMGRNKLNLPLAGQLLGSKTLQAALESKLDVTIAVTRKGDSLRWLAPFSKSSSLRILECEDADNGQSASLKAGVKAAAELGAEAVVVLLADQPFITPGLINRLITEFQYSKEYSYISYTNKGKAKPPVLFAAHFFSLLEDLEGDQGARALIRKEGVGQGKRIEWENDFVFFDVDSEADYQFLLDNWLSLIKLEG